MPASNTLSSKSLVITNARLATCAEADNIGEILDAELHAQNGLITYAGPRSQAPTHPPEAEIHDAQNNWLLPGLIDCHTHLVYAGNRADEFEKRLHGATYQDIAAQGGGILSTVRATRQASVEELQAQAQIRLNDFLAQGVTTIDIKSGYGLDLETELKQLQVAHKLAARNPVRIVTGLLAAHTLSPEFTDQDDYIDHIITKILPAAKAQNLVDYVDAFCESVGFTPAQTRRLFHAAKSLGLPVRLHADQLSNLEGAALAAEHQALSADHLEYTSEASVQKMAENGTVAVLLPGAFYTLRETQIPPVDLFRQNKVPMAVSTDCNPGTSPTTSLLTMLNMACTLFRLTPTEAILGVTQHAAQALNQQKKTGSITPGQSADLSLWNIDHPRDLCYNLGPNPLVRAWFKGLQTQT